MKKTITAVAAVLALSASLAVAAPNEGGHHRGRHQAMMGRKMAQKLGLTAGQQQQLRDIRKSFREQNASFFAAARQTRQEVRAARQANDQGKLDALRTTLQSQREQMKQLRAQEREQILNILTPGQRAQLEQLRAQRKAKRDARQQQQ